MYHSELGYPFNDAVLKLLTHILCVSYWFSSISSKGQSGTHSKNPNQNSVLRGSENIRISQGGRHRELWFWCHPVVQEILDSSCLRIEWRDNKSRVVNLIKWPGASNKWNNCFWWKQRSTFCSFVANIIHVIIIAV